MSLNPLLVFLSLAVWLRGPDRHSGARLVFRSCWATARGCAHVGGGPSLVDGEQTLRVEIGLGVEQGAALAESVGTVLLNRVAGLFSRDAAPLEDSESADLEVAIPRAANRSQNSASV